MTDDKIALSTLLEKSSDTSFLREMIGFAAERLMALETEARCSAAPGERSIEWLNQRNGYRDRSYTTRWGTIQLVMIDQVLVAKGNADDALHHQDANLMLDQLRPPAVGETPGKAFGQPDRPIGRTEQQRASIRGDRPAVEPRHHDAARSLSKFKLLRATLCRHREIPINRKRSLLQKHFRRFGTPMHLPS